MRWHEDVVDRDVHASGASQAGSKPGVNDLQIRPGDHEGTQVRILRRLLVLDDCRDGRPRRVPDTTAELPTPRYLVAALDRGCDTRGRPAARKQQGRAGRHRAEHLVLQLFGKQSGQPVVNPVDTEGPGG
ncbi:Uncharacterised protein [Mycobacteroides abscessus subsp. massiliense]|nr:Uncharacterised protein [Mycobacteroides abscessus subsp. massiliense]